MCETIVVSMTERVSALKKLVITLILLCSSFSLFYASEIFSAQKGNWILSVKTEAIIVLLLFAILIICMIFVFKLFLLGNHETKKRYEYNFQYTPSDQLFRRYVRGEISFEKFIIVQKEIRSVNSEIEKHKIVASAKSDVPVIIGNC